VFAGPDPEQDRVLLTGDAFAGSTVTNVVFCREGLNLFGQLAMLVQLEDGRTLVVRATPRVFGAADGGR
jgi:hypothetical protein